MRLLEARGEGDRERAEIREAERVHLVHQRAGRGAATARTDFRIETRVARPRVQVAADETERPIAPSADLADAVAQAHFAELHERAVFHDVVVRAKEIVEAADTRALARAGAPAVAGR